MTQQALYGNDLFGEPVQPPSRGLISDEFLVPPFSILDARSGFWQQRKAAWLSLGIQSELGRKANLLGMSETILENSNNDNGTSVFDPVLCELAYRWFCPTKGSILDPFAGGSVRGIVAAYWGYRYTGIDLRAEQCIANHFQASKMELSGTPTWHCHDSHAMSEILPDAEQFDMVFTCPPYYDLEQYSDDVRDGSNFQSYGQFIDWYAEIFGMCYYRLRSNRFLVLEVGEIRDRDGIYRNFVGDTVQVMKQCGFQFYNEAIHILPVGTAALRVRRIFNGGRKLCKTHQNVLVFLKGTVDGMKRELGEITV
jgi:DNA modification methylase